MMDDLQSFADVAAASRALALLDDAKVNAVLKDLAVALVDRSDEILKANGEDLAKMDPKDPKCDRLEVTQDRIEGIAKDVQTVAGQPSPLGIVLEERILPNGLRLKKFSVPLGVIGIIYEARPNVTVDAFSLCFKSGNACILKGGSDAEHSNRNLVAIIQEVLMKHGIDPHVIRLLPPDRSSVDALLSAHGFVDVIIPRGSQALIEYVRENATVPVIETGAGICHTYIDASADTKKAASIIENAKTRRPSVCNALDTLLVHRKKLAELSMLMEPLQKHAVEIFADKESFKTLQDHYDVALLHHAKEEHFGTEFLSLKMTTKIVESVEEALDHIAHYGSKHSEAIVAEDPKTIETFLRSVDAACVYANASTAFSDGAQFGMGSEIGVSTQKLHARGPMGLRELTSYKWVIAGDGQVRTAQR